MNIDQIYNPKKSSRLAFLNKESVAVGTARLKIHRALRARRHPPFGYQRLDLAAANGQAEYDLGLIDGGFTQN